MDPNRDFDDRLRFHYLQVLSVSERRTCGSPSPPGAGATQSGIDSGCAWHSGTRCSGLPARAFAPRDWGPKVACVVHLLRGCDRCRFDWVTHLLWCAAAPGAVLIHAVSRPVMHFFSLSDLPV